MSAVTMTRPTRRTGLFRRMGLGGRVALLILVTLAIVAVVAPALLGDEAASQDVANSFAPPSAEHPLGTDALGRDVLSRTLVGTRLSLQLALTSAAIAVGVAVPLGALFGMARARTRKVGASVIDVSLSLPDILIAVIVVTVLGPGGVGAATAIGIAFIPYTARVVFVLSHHVASRDYVMVGRLLGLSRGKLLRAYVLPNIADALAVALLTLLAECIVAVSALSFLGLGVQPPDIDWGSLLTEGVKEFYMSPAAALAPAAMIAVTGLALALVADSVAQGMDPFQKRRTR
ncbi:ABC transporter permease [Aeromicrobium choanae]|uniref:ABC-type dipeptide/oligopeptide/nickel transport system, permease component n=1 Tax=Aeromicrobium choanae TaxID=1736691 RepID=A0A1T4YX62_9ACTN|nr:ABC transporter permease [Aeromicrobium choanae]SKB06389.1 ABC-type dipeptide/oligopeptide/nickel transport system, permease component [Aeromicrobium choanae]